MRRIAMLSFAIGLTVPACEDERGEIEGTFNVVFVETEDTCDGEANQLTRSLTIRRVDDGVEVDFGDGNVLQGSVDEEGIVEAEGPVLVGEEANIAGFMEIAVSVMQSRLDARAFIEFDGTFPGVEGMCHQRLSGIGQRASFAPFVPTGPSVD